MYFPEDEEVYLEEGLGEALAALQLFKSVSDLQKIYAETRGTAKVHDNDELDGGFIENVFTIASRIKITDDYITIKGIDFSKFITRIKNYYEENNFSKIFMKVYTRHAEKLWKQKKIAKKDMKIKFLKFPVFFALEIAMIFEDLGYHYNVKQYIKIAKLIRTKTWVKNLHLPVEDVAIDTRALQNIRYTLKPYQKEFIDMYPTLKKRFNLDGYLLSFDQGLGKTLTAISLAECLGSEQVVIVCPNSLKENWAYEIKEYFYKYENTDLWKQEVFVHGSNKYKMTNKTKYIIVNLEAIPASYDLIDPKKSSMIIVDEMHNVRNIKGKRTQELIYLKRKIPQSDVLLMSGTPIKALPNEIVPSLMMIDPLFTEEVADLYFKCFNVDGTATKAIVNERFGLVMHRKTKKEVLQLPEKRLHEMKRTLSDSKKYLSDVVKEDTNKVFIELYNKELERSQELQVNFINAVKKYSKAPFKEMHDFLGYVKHPNRDYHESEIERFEKFTKTFVIPNIISPVDLKNFKEAETAYMRMKERATGRAVGQVLHPRRKEMFIELYEQNKEEIIDMIHNATKKTVIFSTLLEVVEYISKDLDKQGVKNVKIVGGSGDRMDKIQKFKNDDDIDVLIATSQTLSTGVTLTEANQMFFFGTPWRSADYDQCCDRIYRIGQTTDVDIYNVLLDTGNRLNLSTRMNDILKWSNDMFSSMIDGE